jgi:hypothetical protein
MLLLQLVLIILILHWRIEWFGIRSYIMYYTKLLNDSVQRSSALYYVTTGRSSIVEDIRIIYAIITLLYSHRIL